MNNYNHIVLQGRVAFDPEVKKLNSGGEVGKFKLACKAYKGNMFIDVDIWNRNILDVVRNLRKDDEVKVTGELRYNSWETPSGERRGKHLVSAETIQPIQSATVQSATVSPRDKEEFIEIF